MKFLPFLATYLILLTGGNELLQAASWSSPVVVSPPPVMFNPEPSNLAIDSHSNAIVGWLEGSIGVATNLSTASLPAGAATWKSPITLFSAETSSPTYPLLFSTKSKAVALWANFLPGETKLAATKQLTLGSNWPAPQMSEAIPGLPGGGGASMDLQGNRLYALIMNPPFASGPPYTLNFFSMPNDSPWMPPITLGVDNSIFPTVDTAIANGKGIVVWKISTPSLKLKASRYQVSNNQLKAINNVPLPSGTIDVDVVKTAAAANGNMILVMGAQTTPAGPYNLYASFLTPSSSTFTTPQLISNPANSTQNPFLSIDVDAKGNAVIAWAELLAGIPFIRVGNLPFGKDIKNVTNLSSPTALVTADGNSSLLVDTDSFGNTVVTWQLINNGNPTVKVASQESGEKKWTSYPFLSNSGYTSRVALSDQGTAVAVWIDSNTNELMASSFQRIFILQPPRHFEGKIIKNIFLTQSVEFIDLHWDPSLAPNITSYQLFRDKQLIATIPVEGPFNFRDQITGSSTYSIRATASNGNKSEFVKSKLITE